MSAGKIGGVLAGVAIAGVLIGGIICTERIPVGLRGSHAYTQSVIL